MSVEIDINNMEELLGRLYRAGKKIESEWIDDDGLCELAEHISKKYDIDFDKEGYK